MNSKAAMLKHSIHVQRVAETLTGSAFQCLPDQKPRPDIIEVNHETKEVIAHEVEIPHFTVSAIVADKMVWAADVFTRIEKKLANYVAYGKFSKVVFWISEQKFGEVCPTNPEDAAKFSENLAQAKKKAILETTPFEYTCPYCGEHWWSKYESGGRCPNCKAQIGFKREKYFMEDFIPKKSAPF